MYTLYTYTDAKVVSDLQVKAHLQQGGTATVEVILGIITSDIDLILRIMLKGPSGVQNYDLNISRSVDIYSNPDKWLLKKTVYITDLDINANYTAETIIFNSNNDFLYKHEAVSLPLKDLKKKLIPNQSEEPNTILFLPTGSVISIAVVTVIIVTGVVTMAVLGSLCILYKQKRYNTNQMKEKGIEDLQINAINIQANPAYEVVHFEFKNSQNAKEYTT